MQRQQDTPATALLRKEEAVGDAKTGRPHLVHVPAQVTRLVQADVTNLSHRRKDACAIFRGECVDEVPCWTTARSCLVVTPPAPRLSLRPWGIHPQIVWPDTRHPRGEVR